MLFEFICIDNKGERYRMIINLDKVESIEEANNGKTIIVFATRKRFFFDKPRIVLVDEPYHLLRARLESRVAPKLAKQKTPSSGGVFEEFD